MDKYKTYFRKLIPTLIPDINSFVKKHPIPQTTIKADGSPVTTLDLVLSLFIERKMKENFPELIFYSEENFSEWGFPLIALDPLDGTQEYINNNPEWAMSLAIIENEAFEGCGWIYNPKTNESFFHTTARPYKLQEIYHGEVSHSEWEQGLFGRKNTGEISLKAVGSIAYKLGRLSNGQSDFVVSLRPKNIWDIAAGTILCREAGLKFYSQGKEVMKVEKTYAPPLIWCHEELWPSLQKLFP